MHSQNFKLTPLCRKLLRNFILCLRSINLFLGAAGLDSSMFSHLKRNWSWLNRGSVGLTKPSDHIKSEKNESPTKKARKPNETREKNIPYQKGTKRKASEETRELTGIPFPEIRAPRPAKKTRMIKERVKVVKKPYYDDVDREALKLMSTLRVDWSKEEDTFLLLSR
jgi:general transcription factor 3C polypeptide 1